MKKIIPLFLLLGLLAACASPEAPAYPGSPPAELTPLPTIETAYIEPGQSPLPGELATTLPGSDNPAVQAARSTLAGMLGIPEAELRTIAVESIEWPDGCLGIYQPGQMCTQAIVPGFKILLKAGPAEDSQAYEFHTDQSGRQVLLASAPRPQGIQPLLVWALITDGQCNSASIGLAGIEYGLCGQAQNAAKFVSPDRAADLREFVARYAPFEAETPAGKVLFSGQGEITAGPSEQRMLAEWARLAAQEAAAGNSGAAWGLALAWQQSGGIAGLCDDLAIYRSGEVLASSCKAGPGQNFEPLRLTAPQLTRLYRWIDALGSFESVQSDPATADALTTRLVFSGDGDQPGDPAIEQAMRDLAADRLARMNTPQQAQELEAAQAVLEAYFSALASGQYGEAASLYAGDRELLIEMNPDLPPDGLEALFQAYCTINGGVCGLTIRNIVQREQLSGNTVRFTLELGKPDGSLFQFGPCCGEEGDFYWPMTQFEFSLRRDNGRYEVLELPIYVP